MVSLKALCCVIKYELKIDVYKFDNRLFSTVGLLQSGLRISPAG